MDLELGAELDDIDPAYRPLVARWLATAEARGVDTIRVGTRLVHHAGRCTCGADLWTEVDAMHPGQVWVIHGEDPHGESRLLVQGSRLTADKAVVLDPLVLNAWYDAVHRYERGDRAPPFPPTAARFERGR